MSQNNNKLKIYLGDITHDTIILVSDTIPINIGFVASYMKKIFGEMVDISLFKYPKEIINAIKSNPPDMIALSNYSWNTNLAEFVASIAKKYNSSVITDTVLEPGYSAEYEVHVNADSSLVRYVTREVKWDVFE